MESAQIEAASEQYVGRWNRLVSTTNWEKGRIIHEWRETLEQQDAAAAEFADETWSQCVGGVSPQHVGRLRRVFARFDAVHDDYQGLYWSHFQAALDWNDGEMWLEGAVQSNWSISQMRGKRSEALGLTVTEDEPALEADGDEGLAPAEAGDPAAPPRETLGVVHSPAETDGSDTDGSETEGSETAPARAETAREGQLGNAPSGSERSSVPAEAAARRSQPFADLPSLPDDIGEAFESFKVSIVRHKLAGWEEVERDDVLSTLDALKELALAETEA